MKHHGIDNPYTYQSPYQSNKEGAKCPFFFLKCVSLLDDFDLIANCVRATQQIIKIAEIGEDTI